MYIIKSLLEGGKYHYCKTNDLLLARTVYGRYIKLEHHIATEIVDTEDNTIIEATNWQEMIRINNGVYQNDNS